MRKKWLLVPVIVGVFAIVSTTAIFAQTPTPTPNSSPVKTFASRVAGILGLSEMQVKDAMDQANKEMRDEAIKARLDAMVAAGRITQSQADEYYQWYQSRPEGLEGLGGPGRGKGFGGHHGPRGFGPGKMMPGSPIPSQTPSTTPSA